MRSLVLVFACICLALPAQAQQQGEPVRLKEIPNPTLLKGVMPDLPKGALLEARVRPFTIRSGMIDAAWHSHPTPIVGYVIEGVVEIEIKDLGVYQFKAGEAFLEPANTMMRASNPGQDPARVVAFQVSPPEAPYSEMGAPH
ncbi:cupin domain-containing protein [Microvirga sp. 3-52]|uniref:cupin domain-containing protein n=1 Tax=Microvirga sp. 3-52 TaxID=2792425 RepID=UPI001AC85BEC|nr:cupin domain-containing protein [Microvirga sp. 3-52]MBO1909101.1 cupin domain-containing protein [Microvirga sp. 3-52]MBS7455342.1 cupin domain-containing protein [Microvirga sp. 3-52]